MYRLSDLYTGGKDRHPNPGRAHAQGSGSSVYSPPTGVEARCGGVGWSRMSPTLAARLVPRIPSPSPLPVREGAGGGESGAHVVSRYTQRATHQPTEYPTWRTVRG